MARNARDVDRSLRAKGFAVREQKRHRRYFFFLEDGSKSPISTSMSRTSKRSVGGGLAAFMAKDCRLTNQEFEQLIDCPLSQEGFEDLLRDRGHI